MRGKLGICYGASSMSEDNNGHAKEEILMSPETIDRIRLMHEMFESLHPVLRDEIPRMKLLIESNTNSISTIATAASSMAATHEKAEKRYARLEDRLQEINDRAAGKGQIPLWSHFIILGGTVFMVILVVLYVNQQSIDATLTSIKVQHNGNGKTQPSVAPDSGL